MYHEKVDTASPSPSYPGDRTSTANLIRTEGGLHILLARGRQSPALLREAARVHALLNRGVR